MGSRSHKAVQGSTMSGPWQRPPSSALPGLVCKERDMSLSTVGEALRAVTLWALGERPRRGLTEREQP